ncbi:fasciclin domain-containing protein [Costertonia aggregata]|uniref:Fasciclin domain-containing protein n=1 Tax=Costertonia aggregata TaxID=343403 RepID=A0A7H9ASU0_9FLAO|nr:fasciclin domain-containing protein [Costertonia aggregata]QLG46412.1 fasciclin domain-containing protein [Costertonia aggregata]
MKNFLKLKSIFAFAIITSLITISCDNDDDGPSIPDENIVEIASVNDDLENLVAALQRADLVSTLEGDGPFTVLAPNDEAFATFLTENNYSSLEEVPVDMLRQVLLNHVIIGTIDARTLLTAQSGYATINADGPTADSKVSLYFDTSDGIEFNETSDVVSGGSDIRAANGIIHVVDAVIPIANVVDFISWDDNFSELEDALTAADQPDFTTTLSTANEAPAPFTIFAPVDTAFDMLTEIPTGDALTAVLQHHVIAENNINSTAITDGLESPTTLEGDTLSFNISGSSVSITDGAGNTGTQVVIANIQGSNGIIHAVNKVLIPNTDN